MGETTQITVKVEAAKALSEDEKQQLSEIFKAAVLLAYRRGKDELDMGSPVIAFQP